MHTISCIYAGIPCCECADSEERLHKVVINFTGSSPHTIALKALPLLQQVFFLANANDLMHEGYCLCDENDKAISAQDAHILQKLVGRRANYK